MSDLLMLKWAAKYNPEKQGQLYWAEMGKDHAKLINLCKDAAPLVIITAQDKGQYLNGKIREPRINPGVISTTDLCLELVRQPNQQKPDGQLTFRNRFLQLPPRLPKVSWAMLLEWLAKPPLNWDELSSEFLVPEEVMAAIHAPSVEEK